MQLVTLDVNRLRCAAEPSVPDVLTDATNAAFIVAALEAGADCRAVVAWAKAWTEEATKSR